MTSPAPTLTVRRPRRLLGALQAGRAGGLAVAALAVALRLPHLTGRSLWYDEASSWQTAKFAWPDLMHSVRLNVHMPLYYLLLKGWMAVLGESVAALRGFSVAFGVLTVLAMERFALEVSRASGATEEGDRRFALTVAGLVALSPFQVFASIEARMYTLGTALSAISAVLLLRLLRDGRPRLWAAYGACCAALLYTHHYALFTVAAQFLFLGLYAVWLHGLGGWKEARKVLVPAGIVALAVAVAYLPGFAILRVQTHRVQEEYWIRPLSWEAVCRTFWEFLVPSNDHDLDPWGWAVLGAVVAAAAVVAAGARRGDAFVLTSAAVPMLLSAAASTVKPVWVGRYFRFAHLFVLATVALAVWKLTRRRPALRAPVVAGLAALMLWGNVAFWESLDIPHGPGLHGAVDAILARRAEGETIVALDMFQYFPVKYYVGRRAEVRLIEPPADMFWGWHLVRPGDVITPGALERALDRGVWVIGTSPSERLAFGTLKVSCLSTDVFTSYNSLHRRVFVHHCKRGGAGPSGERPGR
jgi:mannosyltransferase